MIISLKSKQLIQIEPLHMLFGNFSIAMRLARTPTPTYQKEVGVRRDLTADGGGGGAAGGGAAAAALAAAA